MALFGTFGAAVSQDVSTLAPQFVGVKHLHLLYHLQRRLHPLVLHYWVPLYITVTA